MSLIILNVDEVRRTLSASGGAFVTHDKEVDIVRFALNTGFTDVVLDEYTALRVMYQRPGESQVRAQTLTYYDTDGLRNYYDWNLLPSDLAEKGTLTVALCILRTDGDVEEWHTTPYQIRVLGSIHTDDSDEGDESITPTVAQKVAVLETMIQRVASGAPIVVASTSAMTDTAQIYVLSTDGNWYYHNGTTWVSGGTYGAVATDTTLTQSGAPADAKTVGDAFGSIEAILSGGEESRTISYASNGCGYCTARTLILQAGPNTNNLMIVNNLAEVGISVGDTITYSARYTSGHVGMIAFCGTTIGGSSVTPIAIAEFSSEEEIQTVTAEVPAGTVAIAFFTRDASRYTPTIDVSTSGESGLVGKVSVLEAAQSDIEDRLAVTETDVKSLTDGTFDIEITYSADKRGYITNDTLYIQTTSSSNNNCIMAINDLSGVGLAVGDYIRYSARYETGHIGMIAFCGESIGSSNITPIAIAHFPSSDEIQTVTAQIPVGTVAIAFFTRNQGAYTPTIEASEDGDSGLSNRVSELEMDVNSINDQILGVRGCAYESYVPRNLSFTGKTCYFFGDSITNGYIRGQSSRATHNYPAVFASLTGATCSNFGVNNACLSESTTYGSIFTAIQAQTLNNADYVFIAGGVNDWQTGVDEATLATAMNSICDYLKDNFSGVVIFITPIYEAGRTPITTPQQTLTNVRNVITRAAITNGFYVVQGCDFPFPQTGDDSAYIDTMFQDNLHPTDYGYKVYGHALYHTLT